MSQSSTSSRRELGKVWGLALVLTAVAFAITMRWAGAPPPKQLRLATGQASGAYHAAGKLFQEALAESGIRVDLIESQGSNENLDRLRTGDVDAAFVQGGTHEPGDTEILRSVASLGFEPLWIFARTGGPAQEATRLTDLRGLRLEVGSEGSGTRALATAVLASCGLRAGEDYEALSSATSDALEATADGRADVLFFVSSARSGNVRKAISEARLRPVSLDRNEAYEHHFDYLLPVTLDPGGLDLARAYPEQAVELIATTAALVVSKEAHPALAPLWIEAAREHLSSPDPVTLAGAFPSTEALAIPLSTAAETFFTQGRSFLYRLFPFQIAATIDRLKILLLPLLTLLLPLIRVAPPLYRWRIRRRIFTWYKSIQAIEGRGRQGEDPAQLRRELDAMATDIATVEVPLSYAEELYNLRLHIEMVRNQLTA